MPSSTALRNEKPRRLAWFRAHCRNEMPTAALAEERETDGDDEEGLEALPERDDECLQHDGRPDGAAHGSGCTHSAALAAFLARGSELADAARWAREIAAEAVGNGLQDLGAGVGPVDVFGLSRS